MSDVDLDPSSAMRQAGMTAEDYLTKAYKILKDDYEDWTVRDAIELAKVMAQDFHTAMMCVKIQEIRDSIYEISALFQNDEGIGSVEYQLPSEHVLDSYRYITGNENATR